MSSSRWAVNKVKSVRDYYAMYILLGYKFLFLSRRCWSCRSCIGKRCSTAIKNVISQNLNESTKEVKRTCTVMNGFLSFPHTSRCRCNNIDTMYQPCQIYIILRYNVVARRRGRRNKCQRKSKKQLNEDHSKMENRQQIQRLYSRIFDQSHSELYKPAITAASKGKSWAASVCAANIQPG